SLRLRGEWFEFSPAMPSNAPMREKRKTNRRIAQPVECVASDVDMNETETLLKEISQFCVERGWAESTFGRESGADSTVVQRLREGRVTGRVVDRLRRFLASERAQ